MAKERRRKSEFVLALVSTITGSTGTGSNHHNLRGIEGQPLVKAFAPPPFPSTYHISNSIFSKFSFPFPEHTFQHFIFSASLTIVSIRKKKFASAFMKTFLPPPKTSSSYKFCLPYFSWFVRSCGKLLWREIVSISHRPVRRRSHQ